VYGVDELVVVGDGPADVRWTHLEQHDTIYVEAPPGAKVGDKFHAGALAAANPLIAFRSDDSIWHPEQFLQLRNAWALAKRPAYVGWGHGWFWAPHIAPDHAAAFRSGTVILGTSLITAVAAVTTPWSTNGVVPTKASDTVFMKNLVNRFGEIPPLASGEVYGLWLFHGENMWDRTAYKYNVPLEGLRERVRGDALRWDILVEDARSTILGHQEHQ
jgi:hypothetical protein